MPDRVDTPMQLVEAATSVSSGYGTLRVAEPAEQLAYRDNTVLLLRQFGKSTVGTVPS